jgi:hypothetical protein
MKNNLKQLLVLTLAWLAGIAPSPLVAETVTVAGPRGSELSTTARLNLRVVIPRFLHFRVGRPSATPDTLAFEPAADAAVDGVAVGGTGGDAAGGRGAGVILRSNAGPITIVSANDGGIGGLGSGGGISLSEITVRSDSAGLQTPQPSDAGGTSAMAILSRGEITDRRAIWSYEYDNSRAVEPGSYSATIIYTATSP